MSWVKVEKKRQIIKCCQNICPVVLQYFEFITDARYKVWNDI